MSLCNFSSHGKPDAEMARRTGHISLEGCIQLILTDQSLILNSQKNVILCRSQLQENFVLPRTGIQGIVQQGQQQFLQVKAVPMKLDRRQIGLNASHIRMVHHNLCNKPVQREG